MSGWRGSTTAGAGETLVRSMTAEEIVAEARSVVDAIWSIDDQLEDHAALPREDPTWEGRARQARRLRLRRFGALRAEARSRSVEGMPEVDRAKAESAQDREAARLERLRAQVDTARVLGDVRERERAQRAARHQETLAEGRRRAAERAERHERNKTAQAVKSGRQAELFLRAAVRMLDKGQRMAVWARAKEMFPDDPAWSDSATPSSTMAEFEGSSD